MAAITERIFYAECGICSKVFKGSDERITLNVAQEHEDKLGRPFRFNCRENEIVIAREQGEDDNWFMAKVLGNSYDETHKPYYTVARIDKDGAESGESMLVMAHNVLKISHSTSTQSKLIAG